MMTRQFASAVAALILLCPVTGQGNSMESNPIRVDLDARDAATTPVSRMLYGMNVARWDQEFYPGGAGVTTAPGAAARPPDSDAIRKLAECRPAFLKYPGGNDADSYTWNSPANPAADMDTSEVLELMKACQAPGFFTVNFTSGPLLAADWVAATAADNPPADMWEVGDEVWGSWAKSHLPGDKYGERFRQFSAAMKAKNPRIRMAANLGLGQGETTWTRAALATLGDSYDMVTLTYFPQEPPDENDAALFKAADKYRAQFPALRAAVHRQSVAAGRKTDPKFCLVGFNSTCTKPGPQSVSPSNAVFMAQMFAAMGETGTEMACWWAFRNAWPKRGGDYGILASDGRNTPHYHYWVYRLLSRHFHGRMLAARRDGAVEIYVVEPEPGQRTLLAINTGTTTGTPVILDRRPEPSPSPTLTRWTVDGRIDRLAGPAPIRESAAHAAASDGWKLPPLPPLSVTIATTREP